MAKAKKAAKVTAPKPVLKKKGSKKTSTPGEIVNSGTPYKGTTQAWERGVDLDLSS